MSACAVGDLRIAPGSDLPHRVDPPALALEIGTDQHFAEQSRAEHHDAREQQQGAGYHQWTMLFDDIVSREQLVNRQVAENQSACAQPGKSEGSEEMHRI